MYPPMRQSRLSSIISQGPPGREGRGPHRRLRGDGASTRAARSNESAWASGDSSILLKAQERVKAEPRKDEARAADVDTDATFIVSNGSSWTVTGQIDILGYDEEKISKAPAHENAVSPSFFSEGRHRLPQGAPPPFNKEHGEIER